MDTTLIMKTRTSNQPLSNLLKSIQELDPLARLSFENGNLVIQNLSKESVDQAVALLDSYHELLSIDPYAPLDIVAEEYKVEEDSFSYTTLDKQLKKLIQTSKWALWSAHAAPKEIERYLMDLTQEISMKYNSRPPIKFTIGDIVDYKYGVQLPDEISGGHVAAIVMDISPFGNPLLVPLVKNHPNPTSANHLKCSNPGYLILDKEFEHFSRGTILIDLASFRNPKRVIKTIGRVSSSCYQDVADRLVSVFDCRQKQVKLA